MHRVCVTGAAGFVGHHLVRFLKQQGFWVRAVDYRPPEYDTPADECWWQCDLRFLPNAVAALAGVESVYALAADMGGMGFISQYHFEILMGNSRINQNTAFAAGAMGVKRLLYTSSACIYPENLQLETDVAGLTEADGWMGKPDTAYGVEKLMSEELYTRLAEMGKLKVRIARFHNIYGPEGAWTGGREKAPAALCRKVAEAKRNHNPNVEIWGDGEQTRTFCHIADCLAMLYGLMQSDYEKPLNIGTDRLVSINELVDIIAEAADVEIIKKHVAGPQGVRGRNADLSQMKRVLGYNPAITLEWGMGELYRWVEEQVYASN